ncbi:hypothetical protein ANN_00927 [Periplaneta americana]|uniref:Uncharacterized protein n=1 Tax=Periplaneta americana TaxID=6978 RepID=A0ABQ8TTU7_PERAM|nr:hypothetical protein ANN_00927 [Periplaneta americana]
MWEEIECRLDVCRVINQRFISGELVRITFTPVASNTYAAIIVEQVEAGLVRKHYILLLSTPVKAFTCPLQSETLVVSGHWKPTQRMRSTSPTLKRRQRTVDADRSTPVVVLQRRLNTVDEAVWSVTATWIRWQSSRAVVTLRGPVPLVSAYDPLLSTGFKHVSLS